MDEFDDEGNAAELRFGKEFTGDDIQFLMNDEVHVLLDRHRLKNEQQRANSMNETLTKTLQYTSKQAASKDPDTLTGVVQELRNGLKAVELLQKIDGKLGKLHDFEVAQLANLIPETGEVDEALAWIPSLSRFEDESIQEVLDLISRAKSRINSGY